MALQLFASDFLAIDIGFRYIKIVQVKKKKNDDLTIINYGIGDTPKGCIKNGAIKDKERVVAEIKKVMNENNLSAKEAKIVVSGTNIITRIFLIEKVNEKELDARVLEEIKTYLPINFDEHQVDYKVLGEVKDGNAEKIKVFVTAVAKKIIQSYIEILKDLSLKPLSVDIPANSTAKFFRKDIIERIDTSNFAKRSFRALNTDTCAVLDMGSETTIVNILKNKIPEFNRVLLHGSSSIDLAIFKAIDLEENQMDKAERYKRMYGLVKYKDQNNELEWQCSEAAKEDLNKLLKDIKLCFDFYKNKYAGEDVSKIYLVGGGSQLKGIRDYFESVFEIPTYPIGLTDVRGIEFASGLNKEKMNYLINVLGIAF
ncbi:MAG: type IV pilus assembly protein PilM [Clostridia bacterium]|nr:type IV pilus assembly protein PilM [Clostridia bacterium]